MQLQSLGMTSLDVSKLQGQIYAQLGVYVPSADFFEAIGQNMTVQEFVKTRLEDAPEAAQARSRSPLKTRSSSTTTEIAAGGSTISPNTSPSRMRRQSSRRSSTMSNDSERRSLRRQLSKEEEKGRRSPKRLGGLMSGGSGFFERRDSKPSSKG